MQNSNPANKYLYNGKELQAHTGYYDYGFRQSDPAIGRRFVQDVLEEDGLIMMIFLVLIFPVMEEFLQMIIR